MTNFFSVASGSSGRIILKIMLFLCQFKIPKHDSFTYVPHFGTLTKILLDFDNNKYSQTYSIVFLPKIRDNYLALI